MPLALEVAHANGMFTEHIDETNSDGDTPVISAEDEGKLEDVTETIVRRSTRYDAAAAAIALSRTALEIERDTL
jgi:hypothetical protein